LNLGLAYYDQRDLPGATAALGTAVLLGPEHAETHFNLAVIYEKENRLPEALQEITAALVLEPKDMDAANTHANHLRENGKSRGCSRYLDTARPDSARLRSGSK